MEINAGHVFRKGGVKALSFQLRILNWTYFLEYPFQVIAAEFLEVPS